jgi:hypothetical protein
MPMLEKPWIVYVKRGIFANTIAKFHSERMARERLKDLQKRHPEMKGNLGIYRKRLTTDAQ